MDILQVEFWADIMCPWCAIGYTQFARAVEDLAGDVTVEIRWMPFELAPDMPLEGKSQTAHLAQVYGRSPQEVAAMQGQILATAERAGFSMAYAAPAEEFARLPERRGHDEPLSPAEPTQAAHPVALSQHPGPLSRSDQSGSSGSSIPAGRSDPEPMMWNTFEAHKLLRWALAAAGPEAQARLGLATMRAHFQQRRNIADRAVLLALAAAEGLDPAAAGHALDDPALGIAVRHEQGRAQQAGISSVPTFVVNQRYILQGASEPQQFRSALIKLASMEAAA